MRVCVYWNKRKHEVQTEGNGILLFILKNWVDGRDFVYPYDPTTFSEGNHKILIS